jgi:hypothetical protein
LKISGVPFPVGNPTIVIVISFFSGIQLLSLGVMGEYVGRIYDESRDRPKYIVESSYGWGECAPGGPPLQARRLQADPLLASSVRVADEWDGGTQSSSPDRASWEQLGRR